MSDTTIRVERTFNYSPEKVWRALTDYTEIKEWYFDLPDLRLEVDCVFSFVEPNDDQKRQHTCKILKIIDKELFQYSWLHPSRSVRESIITWELIPRGQATLLRLSHDGLLVSLDNEHGYTKERHEEGWSKILENSLH